MDYFVSEAWINKVDQLAENDFIIVDDFLPNSTYQMVIDYFNFQKQNDEFNKAGIGSLNEHQIVEGIRGDFVYWLSKNADEEMGVYFSLMEDFLQFLNRTCFLSLSGYEFHFAYYPVGSFYKKHLDQFKNRNNRLISVVLYLNDDWKQGDGGELKIYQKEGGELLVEPIGNRCAIFRSDIVEHEVLPTATGRKSLTGWLLYQPATLGYLLG